MSVFGNGGASIGTGIVYSLVDQFSAPADRIISKYAKLEGVTNTAVSKMESSMNKMKMGAGLMIVGAGLMAALALPLKTSIEFSRAMSDVKAKSNATGEQMDLLRAQAMKLGADTKYSAKQAAEGQAQLAMAGLNVNQTLKAMPGMLDLAAAGNLDLALAAEIATNVLSQFQLKSEETGRAADVLSMAANNSNASVTDIAESMKYLGPTSAAFGISLEESASVVMALANAGLKGGMATRSLTNSMANLAKPTKEAAEMMAQLGVNFFDGEGKFVGLNNMIGQLEKSFVGLTQQQKMAAVGAIYGAGSIQEVMSMMNANTVVMRNGVEVTLRGSEALKEYTTQLENSAGSAQRVSKTLMDNLAGDIENMSGSIETMFISIGGRIEPIVRKITQGLTGMFNVITAIAENPIGGKLIVVLGVMGALLFTVGALVVAINAVKWASVEASFAFTKMGMTEVALAFETGGLTGGMWALAGAVWAALAPLLPFIAAAALIAGIVWGASKAMDAFGEVMDGKVKVAASGWTRVQQQIGGALTGIKEVFSTANSEGFSMSEKMRDNLAQLGVLDFVIGMGTWAARVKEFFKGFREGLKELWGMVKTVFSYIRKPFDMLGDVLSKLGLNFFKGAGAMEAWAKWGKRIAYVVGGLITMALSPLIIAVGMVVAAFMLIGAVIQAVIWPFTHWREIVTWVIKKFINLKDAVSNFISGIGDWFTGIFETAYQWGVGIVNGIWEGIKSVWEQLKSWFMAAIEALIAPFTDILKALGIIDDTEVSVNTSQKASPNTPSPVGQKVAQGKAQQVGSNTETYTFNRESSQVKDIYVMMPNGQVLAKVVNDENKQKDIRKGSA